MPWISSTGGPWPASVAKISAPRHVHGRRIPPSAFVGSGALLSARFVAASAPVTPAPARSGRTSLFTPFEQYPQGPPGAAVASAASGGPRTRRTCVARGRLYTRAGGAVRRPRRQARLPEVGRDRPRRLRLGREAARRRLRERLVARHAR